MLIVNSYYSFDIMGDLAFGQSFDMMKGGVDHYFLTTTHINMVWIGMFSVSSRPPKLKSLLPAPLVSTECGRAECKHRVGYQDRDQSISTHFSRPPTGTLEIDD